MQTLQELSVLTDKHFVHNTIHIYQSLFEPIRNSVTNILEIGVNTGNSHLMWKDYFPNATIYGLDIDNYCEHILNEERINIKFCDAYSFKTIDSLQDIKFDIIIDDGPHTLESQKFVSTYYSPLLNINGVMIIEDIPDPNWIPILTDALPFYLRDYSYAIDRRYAAPKSWFHDEILFIVDKRFI